MDWMQLDEEFRADTRLFAFLIGNGTISPPDRGLFDYEDRLLADSCLLQELFVIYLNHWDAITEEENSPGQRAAQWLYRICNPDYETSPPFEPWEQALPAAETVSGAIVAFVETLWNGTLEPDILGGTGYTAYLFHGGSFLEGVIAVFINRLQVSVDGRVRGVARARYRAAQFLRHYLGSQLRYLSPYEVVPPFEPWETELP